MPRKLKFSVRKTHSDVTKQDLDQELSTSSTISTDTILCSTTMQTDICMPDYEMADQETQTDFVELCSTDAQTDTIELCTVAIQTECNQVSEAQNLLTPVSNSLPISLPLIYFYMMKLESIEHLCKCLSSIKSIENWFFSCELEASCIKLFRISDKIVIVFEILPNLHWSVCFPSTRFECGVPKFSDLPSVITCISDLQKILKFLNKAKLCMGIADARFAPVTSKCKGVFKDKFGM